MEPEYILLCKGDEGKQLLKENMLQIRLYQLTKITKEQILKQYKRVSSRSVHPISLVTRKRNYYIDMLLSNNQELIILKNQQYESITSLKVEIPLQLQVVYPDNQYLIQSHVDVDTKYFTLLQKIGEGTFAQIFLAEQKYDRKLVTIKRINKTQFLSKGNRQLLLNEFTSLRYRYPHKVNLLYLFENTQFIFFVTDFCVYGDLYKLIKQQSQNHDCQECGKLHKSQKYSIWLQVAFMIVHMHQKGFIYRDLKPENILIDERGFIKLCDFGYSIRYEKNQTFKTVCGTLEYIPPQLALGQPYDKTIDLYGLGILLYELIANHSPFPGITLENMKVKKTQPIAFDMKIFAQSEKDLIEALTRIEPQQRLGCSNSMMIFKHPFFDSKEVFPLVQNVIKRVPDIHLLMKLDQIKPKQIQQRPQQLGQHERFFQRQYNYLNPPFEIEQKIGPKFNSSF